MARLRGAPIFVLIAILGLVACTVDGSISSNLDFAVQIASGSRNGGPEVPVRDIAEPAKMTLKTAPKSTIPNEGDGKTTQPARNEISGAQPKPSMCDDPSSLHDVRMIQLCSRARLMNSLRNHILKASQVPQGTHDARAIKLQGQEPPLGLFNGQSTQVLKSSSPSTIMKRESNMFIPVHDARAQMKVGQADVVDSGNTQKPSFLPSASSEQSAVTRQSTVALTIISSPLKAENRWRKARHDARFWRRPRQAAVAASNSVQGFPIVSDGVVKQSTGISEEETKRQARHDARLAEQSKSDSEDGVIKQEVGDGTENKQGKDKDSDNTDNQGDQDGGSKQSKDKTKKTGAPKPEPVEEEEGEETEPEGDAATRVSCFVWAQVAALGIALSIL